MIDAVIIREVIRIDIGWTVKTGDSIEQYRQDRGRPRYEQNYRRGNFRGNARNFDRENSRGEYRNN